MSVRIAVDGSRLSVELALGVVGFLSASSVPATITTIASEPLWHTVVVEVGGRTHATVRSPSDKERDPEWVVVQAESIATGILGIESFVSPKSSYELRQRHGHDPKDGKIRPRVDKCWARKVRHTEHQVVNDSCGDQVKK